MIKILGGDITHTLGAAHGANDSPLRVSLARAPGDFELDFSDFHPVGSEQFTLHIFAPSPPDVWVKSNGQLAPIHPLATRLKNVWRVEFSNSHPKDCLQIRQRENDSASLITSIETNPYIREILTVERPFRRSFQVLKILCILVIVAGLIALALHSDALSTLQKRFAVLIGTGLSALAFLGLKLTPEPIWNVLFRALRRWGSGPISAFLVLLLVGEAAFLWTPTQCIFRSYLFERKIQQATTISQVSKRIELAKDAIVLFPGRIEPYVVLSKAINDLRISSRSQQKQVSQEFMQNADVRSAILGFLNNPVPCDCSTTSNDDAEFAAQQILSWYFYREAEALKTTDAPLPSLPRFAADLHPQVTETRFYQLRAAVWKFETQDYEAVLERFARGADWARLHKNWPDDLRPTYDGYLEVRTALFADGSRDGVNIRKDFPTDYLVQASLDKMFSHALRTCNFRFARQMIAETIHLRQRSRDTEVLWLDSAEKFEIFQFMRALRSTDMARNSGVFTPAQTILETVQRCDNWTVAEQKSLTADLKQDFPQWMQPEEKEWVKGAVEGHSWGELSAKLVPSARNNWRY